MKMKLFLFFLGFLVIFTPIFSEEENEYVKTFISLDTKEIKAGGNGNINISFKPENGIYINIEPEVEVTLDNKFAVIDTIITLSGKNKDYLDLKKPVKANFKISNNLKEGTYQLKGSLIYFYCSEKEGWCSRYKQPFNLNLKIVK